MRGSRTMNRRTFLETGAATAAAYAFPWFASPGRRRLSPVGLQLYTVRSEMEKSVETTLERVAAIGYREVEFAGYFGRSPEQIRDALRSNGLAAPAGHVSLDALRDDADAVFDAARRAGHGYVVVPWIVESDRESLSAVQRTAESFNRIAERARAAGLRFAYHNHDFEFEHVEGRVMFDVLLEETDPDLVAIELDLYWTVKGGADPLAYFARYPGRFPLVHVKDMDEAGAMVDVGAGKIDFERIFAQSGEAGIRHYFVEHDRPSDPFGSIEASFGYLRRLQ